MGKKKIKELSECKTKGCHEPQVEGAAFCAKHLVKNDPQERVEKVTEIEALKWAKTYAEVENCRQAVRLCQYEIEKVERAARDKLDELSRQIAGETNRQVAALRQKIKMEESDIARSKPFYDDLVKGLSEKYNIPIEGMVIDPENRIIRDMSSSLAKPNPEPKEK